MRKFMPLKSLVTTLTLFVVFICHYEDGSTLQGGIMYPPEGEPCITSLQVSCPDPNGSCLAREKAAEMRSVTPLCQGSGGFYTIEE